MTARAAAVRAIFAEALKRASPSDRAAYVAHACGDDDELQTEIEGLLRALAAVPTRPEPAVAAPNATRSVVTAGALDETGIVLDQVGEGDLSAGDASLQHKRAPAAARCV